MTGQTKVLDRGPFLHGTKAVLQVGDQLTQQLSVELSGKKVELYLFHRNT